MTVSYSPGPVCHSTGHRDTADQHKLGVVLDRAQCHHNGACRRKAAGLESEKENCWQEPRAETERNGSEGGRRGQEPRAADGLGKPGSRAGEQRTLAEPPEGAGPAGASMSGRLTPGTARQATARVGIRKRGDRERTKPRSHFVFTPSLHFHFRVKQGAVGPWFAVPLPPRQLPPPPPVCLCHPRGCVTREPLASSEPALPGRREEQDRTPLLHTQRSPGGFPARKVPGPSTARHEAPQTQAPHALKKVPHC